MSGKGDNQRPSSVSREVYLANWARVFRKKEKHPRWPTSETYIDVKTGETKATDRTGDV